MSIVIHKKDDFKKMNDAGNLAARVLDYIEDYVTEGISTNELNDLCHEYIIKNNAIPAPLNYNGFPKSICTSVNHVVCHGIPSEYKLQKSDIINIDVTVILDGWHGDTSRMFYIDKIPLKTKKLIRNTKQCLDKAISIIKPGIKTGDIGNIIQNHAEEEGLSVVRDYCGHGIGKTFHAKPNILHYGEKNTGIVLKEGMFFTIEPMINLGKAETILSQYDGWTVTTKDKSLSAQFEHTIGITKEGCQVFTLLS